ncbi:MAG: transcriptional activator NhaR [Planctomycetaceae bacterium]|nr:transcriptional activator NhaR [Planctomycetaceae bacterium]
MADWLNYHHLFYFWTTARLGSIAAAARELNLSRPTISAQLQQLERFFGQTLIRRPTRSAELTEFGQTVFQYADAIFVVGRELQNIADGRGGRRPTVFRVGMPDALPKLIAYRLLRPTLTTSPEIRMVCAEGKLDDLLSDLSVHRLDIVLSDRPASPTIGVRAYNHLLGESAVSFFASESLIQNCESAFPDMLNALPVLLPVESTMLRRDLDQWFEHLGFHPQIKAEFEDTALMKVFGQAGEGVFPAPTVIADDVCRQYQVRVVGNTALREQFFAISVERRIKHPAVLEISRTARDILFVNGSTTRGLGP